jgi:hypothetical protein
VVDVLLNYFGLAGEQKDLNELLEMFAHNFQGKTMCLTRVRFGITPGRFSSNFTFNALTAEPDLSSVFEFGKIYAARHD